VIKFWPSKKGVCGGAKIFGSVYYSQRAVFASPSTFFIETMMMLFSKKYQKLSLLGKTTAWKT